MTQSLAPGGGSGVGVAATVGLVDACPQENRSPGRLNSRTRPAARPSLGLPISLHGCNLPLLSTADSTWLAWIGRTHLPLLECALPPRVESPWPADHSCPRPTNSHPINVYRGGGERPAPPGTPSSVHLPQTHHTSPPPPPPHHAP